MFRHIAIMVTLTVLLSGCSGGEGTTEEREVGGTASGEEVLVASDDAPDSEAGAPDDGDQIDTPADTVGVASGRAPADTPGETPLAAPDETPGGSRDAAPVEDQTTDASETPDVGEAEPTAEGGSHLRVIRAYVCKGIEQSEPTEAGKSFVPEDGVLRLCCFSEIAGASGPDIIQHVWRWGDREMARVELEVKSSRWRTWSTKRILDEWRGEWHVDITDANGVLLSSLEFSVE